MSSQIAIYNLALSHIGIGTEVASITERSQEALALNRFYVTTRDAVIRAFLWPFATKIVTLGLVEADPNDEWGYSYRYPSDCLFFRRVLSGIRNDTRQSRVPCKIASDSSGQLVYTDSESAQAEYTARITDAGLYPADFELALSLRLASQVAPRLTGGDPFKLGERSLALYNFHIATAEASATSENQDDEQPEAQMIRDRE